MTKEEIIGKQFNLDLGSSTPVEMVVRDITKDKVIVEYLYSTPGRMEEFKISEFEEMAMIKINPTKTKKMKEPNNQYGVDAQAELEKLLWEEQNESKEDFYMRIKEVLNIESFMVATDNNLDMLFKYMFSATTGIRLSNFTVAEFIKDEYGDDFYLRREQLKMEEHQRE